MAAAMCFNAAEQVKKGNYGLASKILANANYGLECAIGFLAAAGVGATQTSIEIIPFVETFLDHARPEPFSWRDDLQSCLEKIGSPEAKEGRVYKILSSLGYATGRALPLGVAIIIALTNPELVALGPIKGGEAVLVAETGTVMLEYVAKVAAISSFGQFYKFFESLGSVGGEKSEIIKKYSDTAIKKEHIFSKEHKKDGVMKLGTTPKASEADLQKEIVDNFKNIVRDIDSKGLLKSGDNQIKTVINDLKVEIKVRIIDGTVISLDGYIGHSARVWPNSIIWP